MHAYPFPPQSRIMHIYRTECVLLYKMSASIPYKTPDRANVGRGHIPQNLHYHQFHHIWELQPTI
jgi:hypothetical protein